MTLDKFDEMNSLVAGANFLLKVGFLEYKDMFMINILFSGNKREVCMHILDSFASACHFFS